MVIRHCSIKLCANTTTKADVNCVRVVHLESREQEARLSGANSRRKRLGPSACITVQLCWEVSQSRCIVMQHDAVETAGRPNGQPVVIGEETVDRSSLTPVHIETGFGQSKVGGAT